MGRKLQVQSGAVCMLLLVGCTWHDDYRSRQPNVLEEEKVKTSNVSSDHFVNIETNQNLRNPPPPVIPGIDDLSEIPEIQDGGI
ncbi:MAG: hypothetical protein U1E78_10215 [Gammaproteobacteria bacterium]